ncbi:MAG: hypothetical protein E7017_08040 [Alphaproteobacteria bacterium]|nr:hypothetical protein [Alphaproteobacteria bacterium]
MTFVVYDTEYIADKGLKEEGFCGWQNREIIQIAAIKTDDNLDVLSKFNFYIKPKLHTKISKYFVELTGITDEVMKTHGITFEDAYTKFKEFVGTDNCYSHSWDFENENDGDGEVMREMLKIYNIEDNAQPNYKNIAFWFRDKYKQENINIKKQSSGEIADLLGLSENMKRIGLQPHNAFYDVYSILEGLKYLGWNKEC